MPAVSRPTVAAVSARQVGTEVVAAAVVAAALVLVHALRLVTGIRVVPSAAPSIY